MRAILKRKLRIQLVQNHPRILSFIAKFLKAGTYEIVARAKSADNAIEQYNQIKFDVVILDILFFDTSGEKVLKFHKKIGSFIPILLFTGGGDALIINHYFQQGALYCESTDNPLLWFSKKIESLLNDQTKLSTTHCLNSNNSGKVNSDDIKNRALTPREKQVARGIAESKTNKEMAHLFQISPATINIHRSNLMRKLGLKDSSAVTRFVMNQKEF